MKRVAETSSSLSLLILQPLSEEGGRSPHLSNLPSSPLDDDPWPLLLFCEADSCGSRRCKEDPPGTSITSTDSAMRMDWLCCRRDI